MNLHPSNWLNLPACVLPLLAISHLSAVPQSGPAASVPSISPTGGPRGALTTLRISGISGKPISALVSGRGLKVQSLTSAPNGEVILGLAIAANAELGLRELRAVTTEGASQPYRFWVDAYPNIREIEPNDESPQKLDSLPAVVNGTLERAGDRDDYEFSAKSGETWVLDLNAARMGSRAAPVIDLTDGRGTVVASGNPAQGGDPRIVYKIQTDGTYRGVVRDPKGDGPRHTYRLTIGKLPVVTSVVPHGEKPGRKVAVQLEGHNLGTVRRTEVTIPADAQSGLYWTTVRTPNGASLPFPLVIDYASVVGLTETDALMPLPTLPCALEGAFAVYPSIKFAFQAKATDTIVFQMFGPSLGSDVASAIRISTVDGKELASIDGPGGDVTLEFTPKADGVYVVEARDRAGKTGPDRRYRLSARRASADFRAFLDADRLNVAVGAPAQVSVRIERLSGFTGPVNIRATGLPRGVTMSGGSVAAGAEKAEITFSAAANAVRNPSLVALTATAKIDAKSVSHRVVPLIPADDTSSSREALLLPLVVLPVR